MPNTPKLVLPYPAPTATPDVPYDLQQLAQAVDTLLGSDWVAYTPTWSATTPPSLGNGTLSGYHRTIGKTTRFRIALTIGSTTNTGGGQWNFSLPYLAKGDRWRFSDGQLYDLSANGYYQAGATWINSLSSVVCWTPATTAGNPDRAVNVTLPFTWATGDIFTLTGEYERV